MRIWAATVTNNKIVRDIVIDFGNVSPLLVADWGEPIGVICEKLDLARPVILNKHRQDLENFAHTQFVAADFMEQINFDKFTLEILKETKNKPQ